MSGKIESFDRDFLIDAEPRKRARAGKGRKSRFRSMIKAAQGVCSLCSSLTDSHLWRWDKTIEFEERIICIDCYWDKKAGIDLDIDWTNFSPETKEHFYIELANRRYDQKVARELKRDKRKFAADQAIWSSLERRAFLEGELDNICPVCCEKVLSVWVSVDGKEVDWVFTSKAWYCDWEQFFFCCKLCYVDSARENKSYLIKIRSCRKRDDEVGDYRLAKKLAKQFERDLIIRNKYNFTCPSCGNKEEDTCKWVVNKNQDGVCARCHYKK